MLKNILWPCIWNWRLPSRIWADTGSSATLWGLHPRGKGTCWGLWDRLQSNPRSQESLPRPQVFGEASTRSYKDYFRDLKSFGNLLWPLHTKYNFTELFFWVMINWRLCFCILYCIPIKSPNIFSVSSWLGEWHGKSQLSAFFLLGLWSIQSPNRPARVMALLQMWSVPSDLTIRSP